MSVAITILGCGSSGGVPRIGNDWGECDPDNPRNQRQRCSILVRKTNESGDETIAIIDTSPDLRNQLNSNNVAQVDGVLYTHPHADHIHGIDDLRSVAMATGELVNAWADEPTSDMLLKRFGYCFKTPNGSEYPPILNLKQLVAGVDVEINGPGGSIAFTPFRVHHGTIDALGFRVGNVVYTPDLNGVPDESLPNLQNLDVWIVDALRRSRHPSHWSLSETVSWIEKINPGKALITNMHVDLDYQFVDKNTPENVTPCHDGLTFTI